MLKEAPQAWSSPGSAVVLRLPCPEPLTECVFSLPYKRYVDGGFTNSVPFFDDKTTITESPFLGEHDSCPEVKSTNFLCMDVSKMSLHFCLENVQLIRQMVFPPDGKVSGAVCSTLCSWGPTSVVHYTDNPQQTPQGIGAPL